MMDTMVSCEVGFSDDIMRSVTHLKSIARFRFLIDIAPELPLITGIWWSEDVGGTQLMTVSVMHNYVFEIVMPYFNYDRNDYDPVEHFWKEYKAAIREYNEDGRNASA